MTQSDVNARRVVVDNGAMTDPDALDVTPEPEDVTLPEPSPGETREYRTLAQGVLTPRQRRLTQLAAQGMSNASICKELGYSGSRVSILLKDPTIANEVARMQERIFEETIAARLKALADPALDVIQGVLTDRTNRVKVSEKLQAAIWAIEKVDGKAIQKIEGGAGLLSQLMDRLPQPKQNVVINNIQTNNYGAGDSATDVSDTSAKPETQAQEVLLLAEPEESEEDSLTDWMTEFDSGVLK